jgi:hypothetical protein
VRAFWAYIEVNEELTTQDQIKEICEEIEGNVAHVVQVIPTAPTQEN